MSDERTLDELLAIPTLDDIFVIMLLRTLKDGRTRANYAVLKSFFEDLRSDSESWASPSVRRILEGVWPDDVDHMMTRVFGLSGLCSFKCEVGDDTCYMNEEQARQAGKYYDRLSDADKASFDEIARRYAECLGRTSPAT